MQRITLVRYRTRPGRADENEGLSRAVFAELKASAPEGIAYALFRDGDDFVHLFVNTKDGDSAPVTELPAFRAFAKDNMARYEAAPDQIRLDVELVEKYGFP